MIVRLGLAAALCVSCAPSYEVIRQAATAPAVSADASIFAVGLSFQGLYLDKLPEEEYLARFASRSELRAFKQDKIEMDKRFKEALKTELGARVTDSDAAPYRVAARLAYLVPGDDNAVGGVSGNTRGTFQVLLLTQENVVYDELKIEVGVVATSTTPFASERIRLLGEQLAKSVASYLKTRADSKP